MILVDCRTFVLYNNSHIYGALNVSCSDCITRKRLLCGKINIGDLVSGPEDAKVTFRRSLDDENVKIVLYDEDSCEKVSSLKTHPLKVISTSLLQFNKAVYFLDGGMKEFSKKHKGLCVESPRTVQLESISFSPTTPLPEENIDGALISQILPFLYIGNERDSLNAQLLADRHVTHVINVTSHLPMPLPGIQYKRIPASDSSCQNLKQYFDEAIKFIDEARSSNGRVMVHCQAGVSRSATIAMAYIMTRYRVSMMKAFKIVKKSRPIIAPNFNFLGQLLELESRLGLTDESSFEKRGCHHLDDVSADGNSTCALENSIVGLLISNKPNEDVNVNSLNNDNNKNNNTKNNNSDNNNSNNNGECEGQMFSTSTSSLVSC
ncbi:hypothetical protein HELRODRAFT_86834 [Helobdella robusta]|uniref:protein-tyrosine-phosphatase n=1 Tax=Helobdella robusta TaxID=6412 RepID=T1G6H8_HELRO|nr:hypothetical protein HELRODRAFT_86834 [Helobdella robusta]ESN95355.1 hypothetical protein HELRODRAFT_86834 [Helobdella robusta]